jgi:prepilin signal peptidase PulO-like enzyme (type II secretory pathway)
MKPIFLPALFFVFISFGFPISLVDLRCYRIPDKLVIPCFFLLVLVYCTAGRESLLNALSAALFGFLLFYGIRLGSRGLGWGDVKYAAVIGLFCGFPGIFAAFFFAALMALIAAALTPAFRSGPNRQPIPFAPFLSAGALLAYPFNGVLTAFFFSRPF